MKLNKEGRIQLRANIEEQLKNVPEGVRIHLDKDLLEELLFETRVEELSSKIFPDDLDGRKVSVKYLVWSGSFLSKIDLSEVSFDGVLWNIIYNAENCFGENSKNVYQEYGITMIDLSNTNAKIDFSKSFGSNLYGITIEIELFGCNFSNMDLSNNFVDYDFTAEKCNFINTGLSVNFKSDSDIRFYSSILSGLDLSEYTVNETFFGEEYQQYIGFNCDLSNTGLRVKTSDIPDEICSIYKKWLSLRDLYISDDTSEVEKKKISVQMNNISSQTYDYDISLAGMEFLGQSIAKGYLAGCYVNGKKIMTENENHTIASEKLSEYETYKQELFDSVNSSIQEQIRSLKR